MHAPPAGAAAMGEEEEEGGEEGDEIERLQVSLERNFDMMAQALSHVVPTWSQRNLGVPETPQARSTRMRLFDVMSSEQRAARGDVPRAARSPIH